MIDEKIKNHVPRYGTSGYKRRDSDFYATPSWVTKILISYITPAWETEIWEPASGEGHILKALYSDEETYKWIITNPPYSFAQEFVEHAIKLTKNDDGRVAMLLNNNWDAAKGNAFFTSMPCFTKKIVITKRIRWIEGSTGSPRENHAWYIWDWTSVYYPATIEYWRNNGKEEKETS